MLKLDEGGLQKSSELLGYGYGAQVALQKIKTNLGGLCKLLIKPIETISTH